MTFRILLSTPDHGDDRLIATPVANSNRLSLALVYGGYRDARIASIQVGIDAEARSCEKVSKVLQDCETSQPVHKPTLGERCTDRLPW